MLYENIEACHTQLIARTRNMAARRSSRPTEATGSIALFLRQLVFALQSPGTVASGIARAIEAAAAVHGASLLWNGFGPARAFQDYSDVSRAVIDLAAEAARPITSEERSTLDACRDIAITAALTEYTQRRERHLALEQAERMGLLVHELRNRLSSASMGFALVNSGTASPGSGIAAAVARNHRCMKTLIDRSLVEVRLESGNVLPQVVALRDIVEDAQVDAAMDATSRGVSLSVAPTPCDLVVDVDPEVLSGALTNLLQNAFKFTKPNGRVSLTTSATTDRVQIHVEDECGGLPRGKEKELFGAFQQRGEDRTGVGLGLFISRKGIEACGGALGVRDIPGRGCVFAIMLPRVARDPAGITTRVRVVRKRAGEPIMESKACNGERSATNVTKSNLRERASV